MEVSDQLPVPAIVLLVKQSLVSTVWEIGSAPELGWVVCRREKSHAHAPNSFAAQPIVQSLTALMPMPNIHT
jgi:hypothetical protein